jgi:hypothetical protein
MNSKKLDFKNFEEVYDYLLENEIQYRIIAVLTLYRSLNQKQISLLIDKPEPTTYRHAKKLLDDGVLVIDPEKSKEKRGKFFKLTPQLEAFAIHRKKEFEERETHLFDFINWIKKKYENNELDLIREKVVNQFLTRFKDIKLIRHVKNVISSSSSVQNSIVNNIQFQLEKLAKKTEDSDKRELTDEDVLKSHISSASFLIRTTKIEHYVKLMEITMNYYQEISKLRFDIEKQIMEEQTPEEDCVLQFISCFGGAIDKSFMN